MRNKITNEDLAKWQEWGDYTRAEISVAEHDGLGHRQVVDIDLTDERVGLICFDCGRIWPNNGELDNRFRAANAERPFSIVRGRRRYKIAKSICWDAVRRHCNVAPMVKAGVRPPLDPSCRHFSVQFTDGGRGYLTIDGRGRRWLFASQN